VYVLYGEPASTSPEHALVNQAAMIGILGEETRHSSLGRI
jgi:hypothetical protein